MYRKFTITALLFILFLIGMTSQVKSRDLSSPSLRLQLSDEEIEIRKLRARETKRLQQIDPEGTKQTTYEEWIAAQGTPLPFSSKKVITASPLRADSKICVLVNSDLYPLIETSINQYVTDLVSEGYTVEVHTLVGGTPQNLRTLLQSLYALGMDGALFVGDLPIAWYEVDCSWNARSNEQFPCDYYYMDLNGNFYDNDSDGKFDDHVGDINPEIYIGRLTASPLTYDGANEVDLVNNYFAKNHQFRTGGLITNTRALVFIDDDWEYDGEYIDDCLEYIYCQSNMINDPPITIASNYILELSAGYEFVHVAVHSNFAGHYFDGPSGGGSLYYTELCNLNPPGIFYNLFACSNCRFVESNYMGGWYIFNQSFGLAAVGAAKTGSMLNFDQFYYPMGQGTTIGEAFYLWWDEMANWGMNNNEICWFYGNTLLGDPTLKPSDRRPVELNEADLPYCLKNRNYVFELDADGGGAPPYDWNIISGALPAGLSLGQYDGQITGQPTESGIFNFTVSAFDICPPVPPDYEPIYGDTMEYSIGIVGVCGDANNSGLKDMVDVIDIIDYLYNDGQNMCPVASGDMDNFNGTNNNDAYFLYEHVAHASTYPKCPPFTTLIPEAPENILEIRNSTVQPDRDKYRVDFWLNSLSPAKSISIPFEYSCATSPISCDSIRFGGSYYSHYEHKYGTVNATEPKAVIGIVNTGETPPTGNPVRVASAWFTVEPSSEEQLININSAPYGPNEFIIVSPSPTAPYIPSIAVIPGVAFECGDATNDGAVNILDMIYIINYKYKSGPEPEILESADVNSDTRIDILDIVYLINFKYKSGPEPFCL